MSSSTYNKVSTIDQNHQNSYEDEDTKPTIEVSSSQNEDNPDLSTESMQPAELDGSSDNLSCSVDEAIERLGMGPFQFIILAAAGLCFAAEAMQVLQLTFLSEILRLEWNLNDNETALITSVLFIGAAFGTLALGPLADKKGRKPVFLLTASIISFFGMAVTVVSNYWLLLVDIFMVGLGVGGVTGKLSIYHK